MSTPWRPNILFLLVDCLRADYLRRARVPHLARLARQGLHCTHMIAAATTTSPCVASILSGAYSPRHGIRSLRGYRLREDLATLPALLREAGYHTHAEVTGPLLQAIGLDRGFTSYEYRREHDYLDTPWGGSVVERLAGGALDRPWFAFVHLWELHEPRRVLPRFDSRRFGATAYDRALASLDAQLAPLLEALGDVGNVGDNTLIVIHGDHGEQLPVSRRRKRFYRWQRKMFGRPFPPWPSFPIREGHGFDVWEDLIRVPLVLHAPGHIRPLRLGQLTRQVDITPTLLDLLGLPVPPDIDGISLAPALSAGPGALGELEAYIEACGESIVDPRDWRRGIRTTRWKYIRTAGDTRPEQLYDLQRDPRERHDVAATEPAVLAELRDKLAAYVVDAEGEPPDAMRLGANEQELMDTRLRELGYLD